VELIGTVESLDELFEWAELLGFVILVFQANDRSALQGFACPVGLGVDHVYGQIVGGVAVADELDGQCGFSIKIAESAVERRSGFDRIPFFAEVPGADCPSLGANNEPGVLPMPGDLGVRFVAGKLIIPKSAEMFLGEVVGQYCSRFLVVVDCLPRDWDVVYIAQDPGCHCVADAERHTVGEHQADGGRVFANAAQINGVRRGLGGAECGQIEVVLTVLVGPAASGRSGLLRYQSVWLLVSGSRGHTQQSDEK